MQYQILQSPENVDIQNNRIIIRGLQRNDLCNIVRFNHHEHVYWSVKYNNGYSYSLTDDEVEITINSVFHSNRRRPLGDSSSIC